MTIVVVVVVVITSEDTSWEVVSKVFAASNKGLHLLMAYKGDACSIVEADDVVINMAKEKRR